jgi:hypothetical protein
MESQEFEKKANEIINKYIGKKIRCVKESPMDKHSNVKWEIGEEFIVKKVEVSQFGVYLYANEFENIDMNRVELVDEQQLNKMEYEKITVQLKSGYSIRILCSETSLEYIFDSDNDFTDFINYVKDLIDTFGLNSILYQKIALFENEITISHFFFNPNKNITIFIE